MTVTTAWTIAFSAAMKPTSPKKKFAIATAGLSHHRRVDRLGVFLGRLGCERLADTVHPQLGAGRTPVLAQRVNCHCGTKLPDGYGRTAKHPLLTLAQSANPR